MIRKQRTIRSKFRNMTQNLTCQQESLIAKLKKNTKTKIKDTKTPIVYM